MTYSEIANKLLPMNEEELKTEIKNAYDVIDSINIHAGKLARQVVKTQFFILDLADSLIKIKQEKN